MGRGVDEFCWAVPAIVAAAVLSMPAALPQVEAAEARRPIECHCRADGQNYELGARICLRSPAGYRLAECRMQQNVTSWVFGQDDCAPTSERMPDDGEVLDYALLTPR